MRRDSDYENELELERQREIIAKKIRSMSEEDDSLRQKQRPERSFDEDIYESDSKVKKYTDDEIRTSVRKSRARSADQRGTAQRSSASSRPSAANSSRPTAPAKKKKKKGKRVIISILVALVVIAAVIVGGMYYMLGGLTRTELTGDLVAGEGVSYIKNIALFGVDSRDSESNDGRSDTIMIMSVNMRTGEINLISILRDTYVPIDGYGETKINAAYAYGGASLAVKTLNQCFDMDITDYITVNFSELAQIIDATGGVTIEITEAEAGQVNSNLAAAQAEGMTTQPVETVSAGVVTMNGDQAVAYARIRSIDSDTVRASRQQTVLSAVLENIKNMSVWHYPTFIREFMAISESSLSTSEFMKFAPLIFKNFTINTYTVPDIQYETDLTSGYDANGQWCWFYDLDGAAERIHSIIYGE